MFSFAKLFFLALLTSAEASFHRDVIASGSAKSRNLRQAEILHKKMADPTSDLHQDLLSKALPLKEFESKHGMDLGSPARHLADENDGEDAAEYDMISFSGYSLKFAKCQPVQYFSERALEMGEHSPMITSDIVILRLCPTNSCSDSSEYGCHYNFAEYAMELADYVQIMLQYAATKRDYMCNYCNNCLAYGNNNYNNNNRKLEEDNDGGDNNNENQQQDNGDNDNNQQQDNGDNNNQDDNQADQQDNNNQDNNQDGQQEEQQDNNYDQNNYNANNYDEDEYEMYACSSWSTYCGDYSSLCVQQNDGDNNAYMEYEDYEAYLECSQVNINDYAYFVKPRCDGYQGSIKMGIYYDKYCNQYAGNEVNLKNAGLGFRESTFQEFYSSSCLDCSESDYPPYDASSNLCNELYYGAAKCTDDLSYDIAEDESDDSTECSYIESIRFGTYNELGQLTGGSGSFSMTEKMTEAQETVLAIGIIISLFLIVYACYLHHAMTNLLIKSLSHRELLPPSRHQNYRRRGNSAGRRSSGRKSKKEDNEPDWDDTNSGEYA